MHPTAAPQVARVESQIRSHVDRHDVVHLDGCSADDLFLQTVLTQRMPPDVPGSQPAPLRVVSSLSRCGSPGVRRTPRRAPMFVAEPISYGAVAAGKPTPCLDRGRHTELAVRMRTVRIPHQTRAGQQISHAAIAALPGFVFAGFTSGDRPPMLPGVVVYLYLYTAPGPNNRRFGRRTIIVTHVDLGRQDHSDSSWRSAGGGTSQKRSIFGAARDRISTDPDAAVLFERRLGRNCVGVSLRRR